MEFCDLGLNRDSFFPFCNVLLHELRERLRFDTDTNLCKIIQTSQDKTLPFMPSGFTKRFWKTHEAMESVVANDSKKTALANMIAELRNKIVDILLEYYDNSNVADNEISWLFMSFFIQEA